MLAWSGTVLNIVGAFLVALKFAFIGYSFFVVGALAWFYIAFKTKNAALATLNGFYIAANLIGLFNYWGI